MHTRRSDQINVRSAFLSKRVPELVDQTGMTKKQVLEEAVRAFHPVQPADRMDGLVRKGWLLVGRSYNHRPVTLEQANADLEAIRSGERD